jgi:hypothetical protein
LENAIMATTLADTLSGLVPLLDPLAATIISVSRASPTTAATVQSSLATVKGGIADLAASQTAAVSKPLVDQIKAAVISILNTAAGASLPFPANIIFMLLAGAAPIAFNTVETLLQHKIDVTAMPAPVPAAA